MADDASILCKNEKGGVTSLNGFHLHSMLQYDHNARHPRTCAAKLSAALSEGSNGLHTSLAADVVAISGARELKNAAPWPTSTAILRSSIPCLLFFFIYGINGQLRIVPLASDAHCVTLHNVSALERHVFTFSPHRLVSDAHHPVLDVLAAIPYLMHYLIPMAYPAWLHCKGRTPVVPTFYWLLGCAMWAHYAIWFLLPTAPPWVYDNLERYQALGVTPPPMRLQPREGCAFARLDRMTGVRFFYSIFTGNPVPFASFPSGHVAWPMCILLTLPPGTGRRLFVLYIAWVAWATMYTCHHYLIDIVAAVGLVIVTDYVIRWFSGRKQRSLRARRRRDFNGNNDDSCLKTVSTLSL